MTTTDKTKRIVVLRHPQRLGSVGGKGGEDAISPDGARQIWAMALMMKTMFVFSSVFFSGANRTKQAARVVLAAFGLELPITEATDLNFAVTMKATLGDSNAFYAEVERLKAAKGGAPLMVADALSGGSKYALLGRTAMQLTVLKIAMTLKPGQAALALSHAPWSELAAVDPTTMPYGIPEAAAVVYEVRDGEIVASEFLEPPIMGASHT